MDEGDQAGEIAQWLLLCDRFDNEPSVENYVALRRFGPRGETEIYRFAKVEPFKVLKDSLECARLDPLLVTGAMGGDDRDIDELCLQLMERLIERKQSAGQGTTHQQSRGKAISDALVGHLIIAMLEILQQDNLAPRPSLVLLVREHLGGQNTGIMKSASRESGRDRALFLAFQLRRSGEEPTIRKIAKIMDVEPSTVSRWSPEGDLLQQVEKFESSFVRYPTGRSET